jgi:predicted  nucleic acid-binding Zn-ribbon protein
MTTSNIFQKSSAGTTIPATLTEDKNRWVDMHLQATLNTLPVEVQKFAELHEIKTTLNRSIEYSSGLNKRLEAVESYLSEMLKSNLYTFDYAAQEYERRIKTLEDKLNKLLTVIEPSEVALQLTSDKQEIRKMAEEIMDLKRALVSGVANVK